MNYESAASPSDSSVRMDRQSPASDHHGDGAADAHHKSDFTHDDAVRIEKSPAPAAAANSATVLVHGEMVSDKPTASQTKASPAAEKEKSSPKAMSEANVVMQRLLPGLADDADVGVQKEQVVTRDGKADLAFSGTLLAAVAPVAALKGNWQEYRVYSTSGGKHVFSKISRSVYAEDQDSHEAEVFDPNPSSVPSQLLRSARELTRSRPLTWTDAAAAFFGYDPLAKTLYRKLSGEFEERVS